MALFLEIWFGSKPNHSNTIQDKPDEESIVEYQKELAAAFYVCMQEGQNFKGTGDYQEGFFREVIKVAKSVIFPLFMAFHD